MHTNIATEYHRCPWCESLDIMVRYHDEEWGVPLHDDQKQFEFLMMEAMQCGLSWTLMMKKREIFCTCFDNFDYNKIAAYTEKDIVRIMEYPGMIRSRGKIKAIITNAQAFLRIQEEYGSFDTWLWSFSDGKVIQYIGHEEGRIPAANGLSDIITKELKKKGFKYLGSVTVYSHLQACGMINDHIKECFRYKDIMSRYSIIYKEPDKER